MKDKALPAKKAHQPTNQNNANKETHGYKIDTMMKYSKFKLISVFELTHVVILIKGLVNTYRM